MNLFIFSEDLRLNDNPALSHASLTQEGLIALVVLNKSKNFDHNDCTEKLALKLLTLQKLQKKLEELRIILKVLFSEHLTYEPEDIFEFCKSQNIKKVFINDEYPFNEKSRNKKLEKLCIGNDMEFHQFHSQLLNPDEVKNNSGLPFRVFTPFSKKIRALLNSTTLKEAPPPIKQRKVFSKSDNVPSFKEWYGQDNELDLASFPVTEEEALSKLEDFIDNSISSYKDLRDIPSLDSTSKLSSSFAIGLLSSKQAINHVLEKFPDSEGSGPFAWINEIIWREFYKYITYHFPHVSKGKSFNLKYENVPWRKDEESFRKWCEGNTGVPIIDASMRQLNQTKWMHNRLRMITAMYLSKNLLIDWRKGEKYFMENLIDGDFCSNNGGWQWSASTGVDASPYFRIFNPITQSEKFDPEGIFIKKFIPELTECPTNEIHNPSPDTRSSLNYPEMIVDLKSSRLRAIDAFKSIK